MGYNEIILSKNIVIVNIMILFTSSVYKSGTFINFQPQRTYLGVRWGDFGFLIKQYRGNLTWL